MIRRTVPKPDSAEIDHQEARYRPQRHGIIAENHGNSYKYWQQGEIPVIIAVIQVTAEIIFHAGTRIFFNGDGNIWMKINLLSRI